MNKIAAAFVKAQKNFAPALKQSVNPHFKSKYVDLAGCVEAVIDALNENGIALVQHTHESDTGVIVETMFVHESGETMSCGKLHVPAAKQDPQGYGSALTYARRYSLMAACGIAPEDDDGNAASKKPPKGVGVIKPTDGAWEAMDEETQHWMLHEAMAVTQLISAGDVDGACKHIDSLEMENEYKVAFWTRLDSKQRAALKKQWDLMKNAERGQA